MKNFAFCRFYCKFDHFKSILYSIWSLMPYLSMLFLIIGFLRIFIKKSIFDYKQVFLIENDIKILSNFRNNINLSG